MSSNARLYTYDGKTYNLTQWSKYFGISHSALTYRLDKKGLSFEEAARQARLFTESERRISYFNGIERIREVPRTKPQGHRLANTREYRLWNTIKQKCYNTRYKDYEFVGGRGIKMCDQWLHDFKQFYADMHPCPKNKCLVLIDPTQDYSPENCGWISRSHTQSWTPNTPWFTYQGKKRTMIEWANKLGISVNYFQLLCGRCCTIDRLKKHASEFLKKVEETGLHRGKKRDITDQKFNHLVAKERVGADSCRNSLWRCECECGREIIVQLGNLMSGHTKSCGCMSGRTGGPTSTKPRYFEFGGIRLSLRQWSFRLGFSNPGILSYKLKKKPFNEIVREVAISSLIKKLRP